MNFEQAQQYHAERQAIEAWVADWLKQNGYKFTYSLPIDCLPVLLHDFKRENGTPLLPPA